MGPPMWSRTYRALLRAGDVVVAGVHDGVGVLMLGDRVSPPPPAPGCFSDAGRGRKARSSVPALHLREDAPAQLVVHDAVGKASSKRYAYRNRAS
ncbi:MAG: hypothetical protein ACLR0N_01815 [Bilophila wadsworthia]